MTRILGQNKRHNIFDTGGTDMEAIIDRFENEMAVLEFEDGRLIPFPKSALPTDAHEGDVLNLHFQINSERTQARRAKIQKMMEDVWQD